MRSNPGPFEPFVYLLQTPAMFRIVGLGGLALFSILALLIAGEHGAGAALFGLLLMGVLWFEASTNICRRCRFYGTWHCLGQGMLVSKLFSRNDTKLGESGTMLHSALLAAFFAYGLFWLWHEPMLGFIFSLHLDVSCGHAVLPDFFGGQLPSGHLQAAQLGTKMVQGTAGVHQRAERHVPANARKTIKISEFHGIPPPNGGTTS